MAKTQETESKVSTAVILRSLKTTEAAAKAAAKKERPKSSRMDDGELMERLGLVVGETKTFPAHVNSIKITCAKNDKNRPMFIFNYTIVSDDQNANGVPISKSFTIEDSVLTKDTKTGKKGDVWREKDEIIEQIMFEYQSIGFDTASWARSKDGVWGEAEKAAKSATADKTEVRLTLKPWESGDNSGINVWTNPGMNNDDLEDSEEESEEEVEESEEVEEQEYEEVEAEESEEESEEEASEDDEFNPEDWIDGWVTYDTKTDDYGVIKVKLTKHHAKEQEFDAVDEDGNEWNVADGYGIPDDKCEWDHEANGTSPE